MSTASTDSSERKKHRIPRGTLTLFYVFLALLTGAESFTGRHESVYYAADKHQKGWHVFLNRGFEGERETVGDVNVVVYSRRPIMPALVSLTHRTMGVTWVYAFSLIRLVTIFAAYLVLHSYLRAWFPDALALLGTLFVAASVPLTFVSNWWEILTDFPEILVFTLGVGCLRSKKHAALAAVTFLGTFNRETSVLLVMIAGALVILNWRKGNRDPRPLVAALAGWSAATLALNWWVAAPAQVATVFGRFYLLQRNLVGLGQLLIKPHPYNTYLLPIYVFGLLWILPLRVLRDLPAVLQAGVCTVPLFLLLVLTVGGLNEPRQLMPLYPILVPSSLFALFPQALGRESVTE